MRRSRADGAIAGGLLAWAGILIAGCGYSGSHAAQVSQWVAQNSYLANAAQVVADARSVELSVAKGSALQLRTVCGGLSADAGTLYSSLVTPDHRLTRELASSMEDFFHAAETCAIAPSTTGAGVRRSLVEARAGLAELGLADARLRAFGIRTGRLPV
ncbi:MAG: hypothetical protein ACYCSF_05800 [Acidimicrobiales bacterium]